MRRPILVAILALGAILGFGSGFAHLHHHRWHHHGHAGHPGHARCAGEQAPRQPGSPPPASP